MIDSSEKRNRRLAFELQNSHVFEKCSKSKVVQKHAKIALRSALQQLNQLKEPRVSCCGLLLLFGIIKNTCEGYKGSVLVEHEQAIEKADYKCGKSFYLDPILDTYKKKIIENAIVDKILDMIAKANINRLDFELKKNNQ